MMIGKQMATAKVEEEKGREEEREGFDVLVCPVFATSAMPHDHSGTDISPFWRETGRTVSISIIHTHHPKHVCLGIHRRGPKVTHVYWEY